MNGAVNCRRRPRLVMLYAQGIIGLVYFLKDISSLVLDHMKRT
jgi:hypothetical protein